MGMSFYFIIFMYMGMSINKCSKLRLFFKKYTTIGEKISSIFCFYTCVPYSVCLVNTWGTYGPTVHVSLVV